MTAEQRSNHISIEEMLEAQRQEHEHQIAKLLTEQHDKHKADMQKLEHNLGEQNLDAETTTRRQDASIESIKQGDATPTFATEEDPWHDNSPGLDVMQKQSRVSTQHTPMEKRIDTPDNEREDVLDHQVTDWAGHARMRGDTAFTPNIVQLRAVHSLLESVEQALPSNI